MLSSVPRPGSRLLAFWTSTVTNELISWITLPASFVTLTVSVNVSPARPVAGVIDASRWNPLEIARTWVLLPWIEGRVTSETLIWL